jgi:Flp pilus assembly protein TadB
MLDGAERRELAELEVALRLEDPALDRLMRRGLPRQRAWTARLLVASWLAWAACVVVVAAVGWIGLSLLALPAACLAALGCHTLRRRHRAVSGREAA